MSSSAALSSFRAEAELPRSRTSRSMATFCPERRATGCVPREGHAQVARVGGRHFGPEAAEVVLAPEGAARAELVLAP
eukprot:6384949-Alexandrium_andersonii.AAC.1